VSTPPLAPFAPVHELQNPEGVRRWQLFFEFGIRDTRSVISDLGFRFGWICANLAQGLHIYDSRIAIYDWKGRSSYIKIFGGLNQDSNTSKNKGNQDISSYIKE
jgi:hypothetical protein